MPTLRELCNTDKKIPILIKEKTGKPLFYGKVITKAILDIYTANPEPYLHEPILNIVDHELHKILQIAGVNPGEITIKKMENKRGTIILTLKKRI